MGDMDDNSWGNLHGQMCASGPLPFQKVLGTAAVLPNCISTARNALSAISIICSEISGLACAPQEKESLRALIKAPARNPASATPILPDHAHFLPRPRPSLLTDFLPSTYQPTHPSTCSPIYQPLTCSPVCLCVYPSHPPTTHPPTRFCTCPSMYPSIVCPSIRLTILPLIHSTVATSVFPGATPVFVSNTTE